MGPLCIPQEQKNPEIFIRQGGKGGTGEKKRLRLRSIPPASPLSLTAQDIWDGGGTKPSHNSAVHLSAACKWTRGLILLALRMKSSQGRRLSPGPKEKKPFHCKSLGRDKGLLCWVFRLSCQRTFSALGQQWGHFKRPFNYLFPPIAAACRGSYGKKKKEKKGLFQQSLSDSAFKMSFSRSPSLPALPLLSFLALLSSQCGRSGFCFLGHQEYGAERCGWRSGDRVNKEDLTLQIMTGPRALSGRTPKLPVPGCLSGLS